MVKEILFNIFVVIVILLGRDSNTVYVIGITYVVMYMIANSFQLSQKNRNCYLSLSDAAVGLTMVLVGWPVLGLVQILLTTIVFILTGWIIRKKSRIPGDRNPYDFNDC